MTLRLRLAAAAGLGLFAVLLSISWGCQGTCGSSADCADTDFCSIANGVCLTPKSLGFCKTKPDACAQVLSPVCGCDGKTYSNSCEASIAGISVAAAGVCGATCGGVTAAKCSAAEFCNFAPGSCGNVTPSGACLTPPTSCAGVSSPVCGCDRKTYKSSCEASMAKVPLFSNGECACGGPDNLACEDGRFCQLPLGACLGPSATGSCKLPPTDCTAVKSPVCGCNGVVYDNACQAAQAMVSVTGTMTCTKIDAGAGDAGGDAGDAGDGGDGG
ncbi:MAG: Kazal-type serine protease inhibitor domain-containing protein [Byssovorax sp.]